MVVKAFLADPAFLSQTDILDYNNLILSFLRFSPSQLYTDATTVMLMPRCRSLGRLQWNKWQVHFHLLYHSGKVRIDRLATKNDWFNCCNCNMFCHFILLVCERNKIIIPNG